MVVVPKHHRCVAAQSLRPVKIDITPIAVGRIAHQRCPVQYQPVGHRQTCPIYGVAHVQHTIDPYTVQRPAAHNQCRTVGCYHRRMKQRAPGKHERVANQNRARNRQRTSRKHKGWLALDAFDRVRIRRMCDCDVRP